MSVDRHRLRPAVASDLDALAVLETTVFGPTAWSRPQLSGQLDRRDGITLLTEDPSGALLAGAWGWAAGGVSELLRVAVSPAARRQGLGAALVRELAAAARDHGAEELWLEVRADNTAARALYEALGLGVTGERPDYYTDGTTAVLMGAALPLKGCR